MFDFAWSESALIGVVALIAIGPKDLPVAMKAAAAMVKKARRMAGEFQTHVDDMMRDADLQEVRQHINEIRNFDFKGEIEKAVDADGSIRATFAENPLDQPINSPPGTARRRWRPRRWSRRRRRRRKRPPSPSPNRRRWRPRRSFPPRDRQPPGAAGVHPAVVRPIVTASFSLPLDGEGRGGG